MTKKVGIIGSGLIGKSWSMLFASAGYEVVMYDVNEKQLENALIDVVAQISECERKGLLRGSLDAETQIGLITTSRNLSDAVQDAIHVQECVYEDEILKKSVFKDIVKLCNNENTVLSSSASCILPSKLFTGLDRVSQCIIAHPCNPPALCPLTEIVPHSDTSPDVVERTLAIMKEIGQTPVLVKKEIDGFVSNRMQYAIINEAWRLVQGGYISAEDLDKVITDGLGMRYAFMGPFETCHLNAEGTIEYMQKYATSIKRVSSSFGPVPEYDADSVAEVNAEICKRIPDTREGLSNRRRWRDNCLAQLAKLRGQFKK